MNEQLFNAIGLKALEKRRGGRGATKAEVYVSKYKSNRYSVSFRNDIVKKLGDFVIVAPSPKGDRLYFFPISDGNDTRAYAVRNHNDDKSGRGIVCVAESIAGNLDKLIGKHTLKYWADIEGYYISVNEDV